MSVSNSPIAIIGMACRFPGAGDIKAFWRLLTSGRNAVTEEVLGSGVGRTSQLFSGNKVNPACRFAGFLDRLDEFDASFFRISPVEAQRLDPQQRMMLETSWQALEDAGIDPETLRGSRTGVYAGISNYDYRAVVLDAAEPTEPAESLYSVTGTSFNTAIGRVAFALGLNGPAMALDTACSSSLVAIHQAISGLQRKETNLALAGGVHVILSGELFEMRANAGMLSPDGRCATFDAGANGYVRGEGCGILILKRLEEAESDGDRIWAVIRGAAVNQDGATPGLTVPSAEAQIMCIEDALERAGLEAKDVDYVEAHGTGTEVGDPLEALATSAAYGNGREPEDPVLIGSVKTNIGHLEAAAGVAAVIKTVLAIRQRTIPKHLHFNNPNPAINWDEIFLRVTKDQMDWPARGSHLPRAGVSGFGWSGTNAHLILEAHEAADVVPEYIDPDDAPWPAGPAIPIETSLAETAEDGLPRPCDVGVKGRVTRVLPLSGKSNEALRDLGTVYLDWVNEKVEERSADHGAIDSLLADMSWTAGIGRSHFDYRAGVVFRDTSSLIAGLQRVVESDERPAAIDPKKVAFAYAGQATQWPGMGAELYTSEPVVRAVLDHCDAVLRDKRDASLLDVMLGRAGAAGDLDDPQWKQPAIYALECAVTALWKSLGIRPDIVLGHSLGELAAAHTAGVFGLEDGLHLAAIRGELFGEIPGEGAMAAVFLPASRVAELIRRYNASAKGIGLCIAADNGAHQAISGPAADVDAFLKPLEAADIRVARLRKSPAYHSAMIEPALDELEEIFSRVAFASPAVPFITNLDGRLVGEGEVLDAAYWRKQMRSPVAFRSCVETMAQQGVDAIVDIGPHSVVGPMTTLAWPDSVGAPQPPVAISSLKRPGRKISVTEAEDAFHSAVAEAYEAGLPIRFDQLFAAESRRRISLPGYPFRRDRHWITVPRRRRSRADHPLLGSRHESASGEISFDTELFPSDPAWLADHRVFNQLVAPGAIFGAMALEACRIEHPEGDLVTDFQMVNALVFPDNSGEDDNGEVGRQLQVLLDNMEDGEARRIRILTKGATGEAWTLHAEGRVSANEDTDLPKANGLMDIVRLKSNLTSVDISAYYRAKEDVGIDLGPSFRTLKALWARPGEALGEVYLQDGGRSNQFALHPLLLDGFFQVMGAARTQVEAAEQITYLPFGWELLSVQKELPEQLLCHVRMRPPPDDLSVEIPEALTADITLYDLTGVQVGILRGYAVKRASRSALLAAVDSTDDLLYEIVWRDCPLPPGMPAADFLPSPSEAEARSQPFSWYLGAEGVKIEDETGLQEYMERVSWCYALATLEKLGWERITNADIDLDELREQLEILPEHANLLRRLLEILARSGVLRTESNGFVVAVGSGDPLPDGMPMDMETALSETEGHFPHATNEIGLFRRCAGALPDVLRGNADPLSLLFGAVEPTAGDLYRRAPAWRAANNMMGEVIRILVGNLPADHRLRVLEVGAGIGSATDRVIPELPSGRFEYMYTDISAGFFADAESRFSGEGVEIDYRMLDIEKDPLAQGFEAHAYDLVIAANVLHATRFLDETLAHCRVLLAPSGLLVALENQRGRGWMDLIFGQLDGWWRFDDRYRTNHALAGPEIWHRALADTGFEESAILGLEKLELAGLPDRGVIVAQGPSEIELPKGSWVLAGDRGGMAAELATQLAGQNQHVVYAGDGSDVKESAENGIIAESVAIEQRESWRSIIEGLPSDIPLAGIVHLVAVDGHGRNATTEDFAADTQRHVASAMALVQGLLDADAVPEKGLWFVTRGAQVLERERVGQLTGAALWGIGRVITREAPQLNPRMLDLDPEAADPHAVLTDELLFADSESHIAHRLGRRQVARLIRADAGEDRLALPEDANWVLAPDESGAIETLQVHPQEQKVLEPKEVRVAVKACGLNFLDVFRAMGLVEEGLLGEELCGRIIEVGTDVSEVSVGDRVAGFAFGTFGPEVVTREELVALAPPNVSAAALATLPSVFVTCVLSFELADLKAGDQVLVHAGAGGVGLAAIQLAQAAGAEVFATASERKRDYLRSFGVKHVFDSRTIEFGAQILEATDGRGIDIVLNSLTGEGFIESSLSCLAQGGRFVELARRDILSPDEMNDLRPDVSYSILDLYSLKLENPAQPGQALRQVLARIATGELAPPRHTRWPIAETSAAMAFMRAARHIGKIVLTMDPLATGQLRMDGTYLVTGGLGGIGCVLAGWLAERGAGLVVLNGRRPPDAVATAAIEALRGRGFAIEVELADVTDTAEVDAMLERIESAFPPLAGVIHSVGVLADAALGNQSWERFETVLWPKMLGAWHLHRRTMACDLDMFILFSSVAGVLGNPGQANHAAANAFLDQLAAHRRALGLPGQAIAWGAWSELGEAEEQRERIAGRREASGTGWFTPEQGFRVFEQLLRQDSAHAAVAAVDWPVFGDALGDRPAFLEDLLAVTADEDDQTSSEDLLYRLSSTPIGERESLLISFVQQEVQAVLRLPTAPVPTIGFFDLGMDSLMAVELRNRLNRAFSGVYSAPNTLVFDYPTIADLAHHLVDALGEPAAAPEPLHAPTQPQVVNRGDGIAVIGMACRFPGAPDLRTFWSQLEAGVDAVSNGRQDNGPWAGLAGDPAAGDAPSVRGGFVNHIDRFDARFFNMTPIGTRIMDPQQRLLLETSWRALEDAGINPDSLRGSETGVYAGIASSEYRDLMMLAGGADINYLGTSTSMAIGGVAYKLGLMGPAIPVLLNCAASLVAVHHAVSALQEGEVNLALVGGVNALFSPGLNKEMLDLGMLSPEGQCRTFDASANGTVRSEGCGMVVLKRLEEAEADGDRIWGVIRGTAINQNGATAGPTVPNGRAQQRVIGAALKRAGIVPGQVDYLEAHGGGSALGDPIEVQAAAAVYGEGREQDRPLLIGSVKTNIGHLESAAGIAGLIKVLLSMKHGLIPKQLHFNNPNENVDWASLPVQVTSESIRWPNDRERPRYAGVSAFGISGINAHAVIEDYEMAEDSPQGLWGSGQPVGPVQMVGIQVPEPLETLRPTPGEFQPRSTRVLAISGKSEEALRDLASRYLDWMDAHDIDDTTKAEDAILSDMAWTAGIGRDHFQYRKGIAFKNAGMLRESLQAAAQSNSPMVSGQAPKLAFLYADAGKDWSELATRLYQTEPVVRAVLDRCSELLANGSNGDSLLGALSDLEGLQAEGHDRTIYQSAIFALECAITALWGSVGVSPHVVTGCGVGELAAAWNAGVFDLESGLVLASAYGSSSDSSDITLSLPSKTIISQASGQVIDPADVLAPTYWGRLSPLQQLHHPTEALKALQVDLVLNVGPGQGLNLATPIDRQTGAEHAEITFEQRLARVYETGMPVVFAGLFAGEARRRISLPDYPFQRKRFWFNS